MKHTEPVFKLLKYESFNEDYYNICKPIRIGTSKEECARREAVKAETAAAKAELDRSFAELLRNWQAGEGGIKGGTIIALVFGSLILLGGISYVIIRARKKKV